MRRAAAETQTWCSLACSNEAVASGLRTTLDALILPAGAGHAQTAEESFGDSGLDDAQSCTRAASLRPGTRRPRRSGRASKAGEL